MRLTERFPTEADYIDHAIQSCNDNARQCHEDGTIPYVMFERRLPGGRRSWEAYSETELICTGKSIVDIPRKLGRRVDRYWNIGRGFIPIEAGDRAGWDEFFNRMKAIERQNYQEHLRLDQEEMLGAAPEPQQEATQCRE